MKFRLVVTASDQVAFDDFWEGVEPGLEDLEVLASVILQRHLREHRQGVAELGEIDLGAVAADVAGRFQPLDPLRQGLCERPTASARATLVIRPSRCRTLRNFTSIRSILLPTCILRRCPYPA